MDLIYRCVVLAIFTVAVSILLVPHYYHGQLNGNDSLHFSIRTLKGNGGGIFGGNGGNKGGGNGGGKGGNKGGVNRGGKGNGNVSGGAPCTEECTDKNRVAGVFICRPKGWSGKWSTQCVDSKSSSVLQDKQRAICGCCDPLLGYPHTSACPEVCSADPDSETCSGRGESGSSMMDVSCVSNTATPKIRIIKLIVFEIARLVRSSTVDNIADAAMRME